MVYLSVGQIIRSDCILCTSICAVDTKMAPCKETLISIVFAIATLVTCQNSDMNFDMEIKEGKARFVEKIRTNLQQNTVRYDVPAHNNVFETHKMQDFKSGLQITCLPKLEQCRLRTIAGSVAAPAGNLTESIVHSWNQGINSISHDESVVVTEYYYLESKINDTFGMGKDLRKFLDSFGYPLYKEVKVPEDATIMNITSRGPTRVKRQMQTLNNDCNGEGFKTVYGVDSGASCNYLKICQDVREVNQQYVFADCNNVHITSPLVYRCQCCPAATSIVVNGNQCACSKMGMK